MLPAPTQELEGLRHPDPGRSVKLGGADAFQSWGGCSSGSGVGMREGSGGKDLRSQAATEDPRPIHQNMPRRAESQV